MGGRYWLWLGARLAVGFAIIAWALSYVGSGNGEKEFRTTLDAMRQVRSFRVTMTSGQAEAQHQDLLWEVDCNRDILHFKQHVVDPSRDPGIDFQQDYIMMAGREYDRQEDGSWSQPRTYAATYSAKGYCSLLRQGVDSNVLPQIYTMLDRGVLQKGSKKTVNGVRCREWQVTLKGATAGFEHDTVCIGIEDHLPYELSTDWNHSHAVYSDYNSVIALDAPEAEAQQAAASN
jgi:hypothetical protein